MYIQVIDETGTPLPEASVFQSGSSGAFLSPYNFGTTTDINGWATVPEGLDFVTFSFAGTAVTYPGNAIPPTVTIAGNQLNAVTITPQADTTKKFDITPFLIGAVIIAAILFLMDKKLIG